MMKTIRDEYQIAASVVSGSSSSTKLTFNPRNRNTELMEKALNVWIEGQTRKKAVPNMLIIRGKT